MMINQIALDQLQTSDKYNLYKQYNETSNENDIPLRVLDCNYHTPQEFNCLTKTWSTQKTNLYLALNVQSLNAHWESLKEFLYTTTHNTITPTCIGLTEIFTTPSNIHFPLEGYHDIETNTRRDPDGTRGGVGLYIHKDTQYKPRDDLSVFIPHVFESLFIEITHKHKKNTLVGIIYRPNTLPKADINIFMQTLQDITDIINNENKHAILMGDFNIDLLKYRENTRTHDFLNNVIAEGFLPYVTKPTRVTTKSATLIDHIYSNIISPSSESGIIITDVADHFASFYCTKQHKEATNGNPPSKPSRLFNEKNIETFKTLLANTDFSSIHTTTCPQVAYNTFMELYMKLHSLKKQPNPPKDT